MRSNQFICAFVWALALAVTSTGCGNGEQSQSLCSMDSCERADGCTAATGNYIDFERECFHPRRLVACENIDALFSELSVSVLDPEGGCWDFGNAVWPSHWKLVDGTFETHCLLDNYVWLPLCPEFHTQEGPAPRFLHM